MTKPSTGAERFVDTLFLAGIVLVALTLVPSGPLQALAGVLGGLAVPMILVGFALRTCGLFTGGAVGLSVLLVFGYWSLVMLVGLELGMDVGHGSSAAVAAVLCGGAWLSSRLASRSGARDGTTDVTVDPVG